MQVIQRPRIFPGLVSSISTQSSNRTGEEYVELHPGSFMRQSWKWSISLTLSSMGQDAVYDSKYTFLFVQEENEIKLVNL